jgi:hypothetical protein
MLEQELTTKPNKDDVLLDTEHYIADADFLGSGHHNILS